VNVDTRRTSGRKGLTLVELTVALAIAGMLAAATLRLTGRLARRSSLLDSGRREACLTDGLRRVLACDVLNAESFCITRDALSFRTHAALSSGGPAGGLASEPAEVVYRVVQVGGAGWLVRGQRMQDGRQAAELVCRGAAGISLDAGDSKTQAGRWRPMPDRVGVAVRMAGADGKTGREMSFAYRLR